MRGWTRCWPGWRPRWRTWSGWTCRLWSAWTGPRAGCTPRPGSWNVSAAAWPGSTPRYVAALEAGDEPARHANTCTTTFLRDQLRISAAEAKRRVALAHACTPPRLLRRAAAAGPAARPGRRRRRRAGLHRPRRGHPGGAWTPSPAPSPPTDRDTVETQAVAAATVSDPARLARWGIQALNRVDPDGTLRDYHYAHAHRGITITPHPGRAGAKITGNLDVELLEKLQTIFDALAGPNPHRRTRPETEPRAAPDRPSRTADRTAADRRPRETDSGRPRPAATTPSWTP